MTPSSAVGSSRAGRSLPLFAVLAFAWGVSSLSAADGVARPLRLTLNENPFGPSPLAAEAIRKDLDGLARYTGEEADELVALVAAREGVDPSQIVLGEILKPLGLQLSLRGGPGGEFVYSVPGYPALVNAAAPVGGVVVGVPLNARLENDLPALAAAVNERTRAVFLVNPHNPSGTVSDRDGFKAFLRTVSARTLVVVDEAYLEFSDDYEGRTAVSLVREGANVLVFRTFAKAYGLAGLPLGYAIAPRGVADTLRKQGLGSARELNRLAVAAAVASLRDEGYLVRVHDAVAAERAEWMRVLEELRVPYTTSQANFVFFDAGRPHAEVADALLAQGVAVARAFPPYDTWVRITIGLPGENGRAQAALKRVLGKR